MATSFNIASYEQERYHYIKYDMDEAKTRGFYIDCDRNSPKLLSSLNYDSSNPNE